MYERKDKSKVKAKVGGILCRQALTTDRVLGYEGLKTVPSTKYLPGQVLRNRTTRTNSLEFLPLSKWPGLVT